MANIDDLTIEIDASLTALSDLPDIGFEEEISIARVNLSAAESLLQSQAVNASVEDYLSKAYLSAIGIESSTKDTNEVAYRYASNVTTSISNLISEIDSSRESGDPITV